MGDDLGTAAAERPSPGAPIPRQLPPTPAHFTSRTAELAALDSAADGEDDDSVDQLPAVTVVVGPGGVGKTALAVTWAVRNAGRFPEGQLYADLRGFSPETAVPPEDALGAFLRALGVPPERVPVELAEQAALFRTTTAGMRLLLVVDNAISAAQVRPLIPASSGCVVVVTSRLRLDGLHAEGARFVDMAPLPQEHAVELLMRSVGESRVADELPDVTTLAALCGRLPIALRVAGARLASRPKWPVARMVAELRDERVRLTRLSPVGEASLTATFDSSYSALPPHAARLYRLLSEHPGLTVEVGAAAAAVRVSDDEAANGLQVLADASLLEEIGEDGYRFHDLVRLHARALPDDERFEVVPRIADWYLHRMTRANLVVIPMRWRVSTVRARYEDSPPLFTTGAEALRWLDDRLQDIVKVLEETFALRHDDLTWQLCEALWELFLHRKHYQWWLRTHETGIAAARRCGEAVAEARLRCQLARAYLDLGRFEAAESECLQAAELARGAGSRHNESVALDQLGMAAQGRGDFDRAVEFFGESLVIEGELGIDRGVALRHRRIGEALLQAGRTTDAARHLNLAREMFEEMGDAKAGARVAVVLARIDTLAGEVTAAKRRLEHAAAVFAESGSAGYQADVLIVFAEVAEREGDLDAARGQLAEALELLRTVGGAQLELVRSRLLALDADRDRAEQPEPSAGE
ncbi:tetratricopeptide repeat protein [Amycolatopsis umgeniensis]|uniref:Tetratricopeptide (TPR) repeat protein n=1 Tax=Amycolatopsis umgeniensis TaxID=336628 RepID=A0A841BBU6_9PSEU|nr:tetratricopeptide repeat protein [Amycolatopsis umgeniensis]MBB5856323.1 tetratricopeptide (TPR) repeat protein [Amycolatopsis umgeniensis]